MSILHATAPRAVHNQPARGQIKLLWDETEEDCLSYLLLRSACLCSGCRARRMKGNIALVDPDIQVTEINNMVYGIQLVFSDGHERGIYPWSLLRQLANSSSAAR